MTATALHPPDSATISTRKGVLFCPHCGHANPVDGDWIVSSGDGRLTVICPDCGELIETRPS